MINEVTLIGRLGADAEIKETSKGDKYSWVNLIALNTLMNYIKSLILNLIRKYNEL